MKTAEFRSIATLLMALLAAAAAKAQDNPIYQYCQIAPVNSGLLLTVKNGTAANGDLIVQDDPIENSQTSQEFWVSTNAPTVAQLLTTAISSKKSLIQTVGNAVKDGAQCQQWAASGAGSSKKWLVEEAETHNGVPVYVIVNNEFGPDNETEVMNVKGNSSEPGGVIQLWKLLSGPPANELFYVEPANLDPSDASPDLSPVAEMTDGLE